MSLYSIEDTTLTALGDAVRSKLNGTTELPIITVENQYVDYNKAYGYEMPIYVKKVKINGFLKFPYNSETFNVSDMNGTEGLGVAPGKYGTYDEDEVRKNSDYTIVWHPYPAGTQNAPVIANFETIVESNAWAFVATKAYNGPEKFYITYTAIGLDENGNEFKYTPLEMVDKINGLMTIPDEALSISGDGSYRFAFGGSDWLINRYGDKITTKNITTASYMFSGSTRLEEIPFVINMNNNAPIDYMFQNCNKLKNVPQVNVTRTSHTAYSYLFANCYNIRELPEWFIDLLEQDYNISSSNSVFAPWRNMLTNCYSLRKIPDRAMKAMVNPNPSGQYYTVLYSNPFAGCRSLDELINIYPDNYNFTSNQFSGWFDSLYRVKNITFATNEDGTPMVRKWKNQTINFSRGWFGWVNGSASNVTGYNSGITADKEVKDDATYQALKDDPDWFSCIAKYSRYNHDSAVNTINSLPDCSAYLATAGGTNTIKFYSDSAIGTDEGPAQNLTEEEIAVATAKGWTVTLV